MLSTAYRLRLEAICKDIAAGSEVTMTDMIWKLKNLQKQIQVQGYVESSEKIIN
ncbi:MAG: hypothetical protein CM15mV13_2690 [uncultured marine virus]|nr:MAG: hypothetical protein CM15mV13_2690 [uncultured marine virus]